jgi:RimJ/RimL family protein N-acetyltransferase
MFIAARNGPRSASTGPRPASTRDLPATVVTLGTVVRRAVPEDLRQLAAWPRYVGLLESLSLTGTPVTSADGKRWWEKMDAPDRCHYSVVLPQSGEVIGIHAFVRIDWDNAIIGNMGIRIRADLCHQGYGSESLRPLLQAVLASGIETIRLDVAATNAAAVRCYEKCGMRIVGEFWRQHSARSIDPADPSWAPLMPHFRRDGDGWLVRFYWMEISTKLAPPRGSTT